jgi:hypothetical protein
MELLQASRSRNEHVFVCSLISRSLISRSLISRYACAVIGIRIEIKVRGLFLKSIFQEHISYPKSRSNIPTTHRPFYAHSLKTKTSPLGQCQFHTTFSYFSFVGLEIPFVGLESKYLGLVDVHPHHCPIDIPFSLPRVVVALL